MADEQPPVSFTMRHDRPGQGDMMELYRPSGDDPPGTSGRGQWFMKWFVREAARRAGNQGTPRLIRVTVEDITPQEEV